MGYAPIHYRGVRRSVRGIRGSVSGEYAGVQGVRLNARGTPQCTTYYGAVPE